MTKHQFLDRLQAGLNGKLAPDLIMENIRYYEDYINTEIRKGKSEEEVLESLGDPRLIARTIVETSGRSGTVFEEYSESGNGSRRYGSGEEEYGMHARPNDRVPGLFVRMPIWVWLVLFLILAVLILGVVFSVIAAVLRILLPILLPILAVVFLVKLFRDWMN